MSGHLYITDTRNLFEDDDSDNETLVNRCRAWRPPPQPNPMIMSLYGGHIRESDTHSMLQLKREIDQRTVASTSRSICLLRNSEQIGMATAEELDRQSEQLQNTEKRLDDINTNLNYSQKHLNGIKSAFYRLKNFLSGNCDTTRPKSSASRDTCLYDFGGPSTSGLGQTVEAIPLQIRDGRFNSQPSSFRGLSERQSMASLTDSQVNEMLDANLEEMVQAIARLKGIGTSLSEEIDHQNKLIDNIQDKIEVADIKIGKQTKEMNRLLGK